MKSLLKALSFLALISACFTQSVNKCPIPSNFQFLDNGKCVGACSKNKVADSNFICNCLDSLVLQSGNCVASCDAGFTETKGICTKDCIIADTSFDSVLGKCTCGTKYFKSDSTACVSVCDNGYIPSITAPVTCICKGTVNASSVCIACDAKSKFDLTSSSPKCITACATTSFDNGAGVCVPLVDCSGYGQIKNVKANTCDCDSNKNFVVNNGTCVCKDGFISDGKSSCISKCTDSQFIKAGACVNSCGDGYFADKNYCVQSCGIGKVYDNASNTCTCEAYKIRNIVDGYCYPFLDYFTKDVLKPECNQTGKYLSLRNKGNFECTTCPNGYYTADATNSAGVDATGFFKCSPCPKNYACYSQNGVFKIEKCSNTSKYPNVFGTKCINCEDGKYLDGVDGSCKVCDAGFYSNKSSFSLCLPCPPGTTVNSNQTGCAPCGPGTFNDGSTLECNNCPKNRIISDDKTSCMPCVPGKGINPDTKLCDLCGENQYSNDQTNFECIPCDSNFISDTSKTFCKPCPFGQQYSTATKACAAPAPAPA